MDQARQVFEALWAAKARELPKWDGKKYASKNVQTYWRWFALGWTTKGSK